MIAYDLETTASDAWHGGLPFFVAAHDGEMNTWWEFNVDPFTRTPIFSQEDLAEIDDLLCSDEIVAHNAAFDIRFTERLFSTDPTFETEWDFNYIEDTMIASHALRNLWPHRLKVLRDVLFCIPTAERDVLQEATNHARRICRKKSFVEAHGEWRLAGPRDPHWPAIHTRPKSGWWVFDTWLPRAICRLAPEFLPPADDLPFLPGDSKHPWETVCKRYALEDVETTWYLWYCLKDALEEEGLWDQYLERKALLKQTYEMCDYGITLHPLIKSEIQRFEATAEIAAKKALAASKLPKVSSLNSDKQLRKVLFEDFKLKSIKLTKKDKLPSTDASVISKLIDTTTGRPHIFLENLLTYRRASKAVDYLTSYVEWSDGPEERIRQADGYQCSDPGKASTHHRRDRKSRAAVSNLGNTVDSRHDSDRYQRRTLHPNISITGTRFTRQSSRDPNLQNVGTGREVVAVDDRTGDVTVKIDYNLRSCFGPAPGRSWLAWDYSNIELRIWGYECGNEEFIQAFEEGESIHLVIARELHPHLCDLSDDEAKDTKDYKRTKNGNFAIIYGAAPRRADDTYGVKGAYDRISIRFPEVRKFTEKLFDQVSRRGYIETLTGYRLYIERDKPHKAVSGFVQGSAGAIIGRAMVACGEYLSSSPGDVHPILQIHDELLFDAPEKPSKKILTDLPAIMASQGEAIGIPLPVSGNIIHDSWDKGEAL